MADTDKLIQWKKVTENYIYKCLTWSNRIPEARASLEKSRKKKR